MALVSILILAIGLSMDSLAIAATSGAIIANHSKINILKIAGMLASVQAVLTILGWLVGSTFVQYIDQYDHWIAFGILTFIGLKVIIESFNGKKDEKPAFNPLNIKVMFGLAVAASIDATAVGLSLSMLNQPIIMPALVIGTVTFIMSSLGIIFGSKAGQRFNRHLNLVGGVMLILIGCSILFNHLYSTDPIILNVFI